MKIDVALNLVASHISPFSAFATQLNLSTPQLDSLQDKLTAAQTARTEALAAQQAAKAKVEAQDIALADLMQSYGGCVSTIRATYKNTLDPEVWTWAQIPAPKIPEKRPVVQPTNVKWKVTEVGHVALSWTGSTQGGTFFRIKRKLPGQADYTLIATVGEKKFVDSSIPDGTSNATYYVEAGRKDMPQAASPAVTAFMNPVAQQQAA